MKTTLLTAAFVTLLSVSGKSQSTQNPPAQPVKTTEQVNPDGTLKSAPAADTKKTDNQGGTRMAITEKGVPASKSKTAGKSSPDPGQGKSSTNPSSSPEKK